MKGNVNHSFVEESIHFYTRRSFYIHVGLFVMIALYSLVFAGRNLWSTKVSVIESSVRVDVVAMPKYTIQELRAFEEQSASFDLEHGVDEELAKVEDPEKLALLVKKKKVDFASMLKKIGTKKVKNKKAISKKKSKEIISRQMQRELRNLVVAGNKLSGGVALTGGQSSGEMTVFTKYITSLPAWVRPKWTLPSYLLKENLKCRIQIFLRPSGELIKATIFESSLNVEYDQRALLAVQSASPFPVVPKEAAPRASNGEIVLGFPL